MVSIRSHADIRSPALSDAIADRAVPGLVHIACLAAQDFSAGILILDPAQKPVGQKDPPDAAL